MFYRVLMLPIKTSVFNNGSTSILATYCNHIWEIAIYHWWVNGKDWSLASQIISNFVGWIHCKAEPNYKVITNWRDVHDQAEWNSLKSSAPQTHATGELAVKYDNNHLALVVYTAPMPLGLSNMSIRSIQSLQPASLSCWERPSR
jgi:hypothetical protein